ncbi:MAG: amidohydrolase family protein [Thaumarchaeota archaeon]|nr:amidohydrolase family protein [Nitrososphaerota archaeon]
MHQAIDCHVHVWPDALLQKNLETIKTQSGISPAFDGTIFTLRGSMAKSGISTSIVNNLVLRIDLMRKANDWTAQAVSNHKDLVGMGWIIAGAPESADEVTRCVRELGFKGIKIHLSHSKIFPGDSSNYQIYEKISELGIPVLFHCGKNPYSRTSETQFSVPSGFRSVLSSFSRMKVILGHLAGYEDFPDDALEVLSSFRNVRADTAVRSPSGVNISELVSIIGIDKFVFGSDFPIYDPAVLLSWLRVSVPQPEFDSITKKNPTELFELG